MSMFGLWVIIFSAVLLASLVNTVINLFVTQTTWYWKIVTRMTDGMARGLDVEMEDEETESEGNVE